MTSLASNIASEEDFREVSTNPLPRASFCLYRALYLSNSNLAQNAGEPDAQSSTIEQSCNIDGDGFESALLSLAYVKLELMDPIGALEMCKLILGSNFFPQCDVDGQDSHTVLSRRRHAIARLYLCEALCLLGDANDAINVLFGDRHDNDETLQRLAEDFAMDATSKATKYDKKQVNSSLPSRIDDARDIVHATASGLFSSLENVEKAKQYASHVKNTNVMEESRLNYSSFERQVLLYCLLKENDTEGAVALLHSG